MPPPRGRGREPDPLLAAIRRKRRERTRKQRKKFAHFVAGAALVVLLVLCVTGFTGAAVWMSSCDLNDLKPVNNGENSFVYAADGSVLGSIPAEKNRQPVDLTDMSKWVARAPVESIARSTSSRRSIASCGRWNGSKTEGCCGRPASSAACVKVSFDAGFEKYVCAAASIP